MSNATDMSTPVTRGELREELERFATKTDLERFATKTDLDNLATTFERRFATKVDLETWGGALLARITSTEQRLMEGMRNLEQQMHDWGKQLQEDLARQAKAHHEAMLAAVSVFDQKYADLPERVTRLEIEVFPTRRR